MSRRITWITSLSALSFFSLVVISGCSTKNQDGNMVPELIEAVNDEDIRVTYQDLRNRLVVTTHQIENLSCDYTVSFRPPDGSEEVGLLMQSRFDSANQYERKERKSNNTTTTVTNKNGLITSLRLYKKPDGSEVRSPLGIIGHSKWPNPRDATVTIRNLCGYFGNRPIEQNFFAVSSERSILSQFVWEDEQGNLVLSQKAERETFRRDAVIDQQWRLQSFAQVRVLDDDILASISRDLDIKPEKLFWDSQRWTIDEYTQFDGVWVPTKGTKTTIVRDKEYVATLDASFRAGTISATEYLEKRNSDEAIQRTNVQIVVVDKKSVQVNQPLPEDAFDIVFPDGTIVVDKRATPNQPQNRL